MNYTLPSSNREAVEVKNYLLRKKELLTDKFDLEIALENAVKFLLK